MEKQFAAYLEKKKAQEQQVMQQEKEQLLLQEGLYTREYYTGTGCPSAEYPEFEYDAKQNANRYYKKVPISLSEEEYRQLCRVASLKQEEEDEVQEGGSNIVAWMLTVLTVVIVIGGVLLGIMAESAMTRLLICFIAIFCGAITAALAEMIKLLEQIKGPSKQNRKEWDSQA